MFRDHEASSTSYESRSDTLVVRTADLPRTGNVTAQLLLDVRRHLVGIDCGGDGFERLVVMLGPHEAVHSTVTAKVELGRDRVEIHGARAHVNVGEKNPYR